MIRLICNESLPSLAALRQVDPHKLTAILRGELDWVVMECLEKDRNRRYPTANGLSMDAPDHPHALDAAQNLGKLLFKQKRYQDAYAFARATLDARRRILPPGHRKTLSSFHAVILTLSKLERYDEAEELSQQAIAAKPSWTDTQLEPLLVEIARSRIAREQFDKAIDLLQRCLTVREQQYAGKWQVSQIRNLLGEAFLGEGELLQAEQTLQLAQKELDAASDKDEPEAVTLQQDNTRRLDDLTQRKKTVEFSEPSTDEQ